MKNKVTGLQLLSEFETLLIDTGIYMLSVGKRIFGYLKKSIEKAKADKDDKKTCTPPARDDLATQAVAAQS